jgi:hypothetical protein
MAGSCKVLNVAEKNDAARELSNIMAGGRARRVNKIAVFSPILLILFFREKDFPNTIRFMNLI